MCNDSCNCSANCSCKESKCCKKKCCCFIASTIIVSFFVSFCVSKCVAYKTMQKFAQKQVEVEMLKNIIEIKASLMNKDFKYNHMMHKNNKCCSECKKLEKNK